LGDLRIGLASTPLEEAGQTPERADIAFADRLDQRDRDDISTRHS
jgi:hypothetical protein